MIWLLEAELFRHVGSTYGAVLKLHILEIITISHDVLRGKVHNFDCFWAEKVYVTGFSSGQLVNCEVRYRIIRLFRTFNFWIDDIKSVLIFEHLQIFVSHIYNIVKLSIYQRAHFRQI